MRRHETDNLDKLLSERLRNAIGEDGVANWLDVCARAGMNRILWHWSRRGVLLVTGVLALAVGASIASTGLIPWLNRKPAKVQAPRLAPPCQAKNLYAKLNYGVSLNDLSGSFVLVNTDSRACSLAGRVRLALINPRVSKPHLFLKYTPPEPPQQGVMDTRPRSLLRAVPHDRGAGLHFSWKNWCGPGSPPKSLELRLPNGDRIVKSLSEVPGCEKERWQTALEYGALYPDWEPESLISMYQLREAIPLRASIVSAGLPTIQKKYKRDKSGRTYTYLRVERGSIYRFRVSLHNAGKRSFRFKKCPYYQEGFFSADMRPEFFVLNCAPVGVIAPGKVVSFAMEVHVPDETKLGLNLFYWSIVSLRSGPEIQRFLWVVP